MKSIMKRRERKLHRQAGDLPAATARAMPSSGLALKRGDDEKNGGVVDDGGEEMQQTSFGGSVASR